VQDAVEFTVFKAEFVVEASKLTGEDATVAGNKWRVQLETGVIIRI
jgi:hypothetical protein